MDKVMKKNFYFFIFLISLITQSKIFCMQNYFGSKPEEVLSRQPLTLKDLIYFSRYNQKIQQSFKYAPLKLNLSRNPELTNIILEKIFETFPEIKEVDLSENNQIENLDFFNIDGFKYTKLTHLKLINCNNLFDISDLIYCPDLIYLNLSDCYQLKDISVLYNCTMLEVLVLSNCKNISKISALSKCINLKNLYLYGCNIPQEQITELKNKLPNLNCFTKII